MNEKQRAVAGTVAIALIVAALFYVPWRVESTGDVRWAPFYRNPVVNQSISMSDSIDSRFVRLKGRRLPGLYVLQLFLIASTGAVVYRLVQDSDE